MTDTPSSSSGNSARKLKKVMAAAYCLPLLSWSRCHAATTCRSQVHRCCAAAQRSAARVLSRGVGRMRV